MHDLLLISDLHLGSHLKPRMRGEYVHLASRIEDTFPRFLEHYQRSGGWQLIVNGDFIDFWNVELPPVAGQTAEQLAVRRLHAVFDAHPHVEDALARFLAAGNGIVFVAGNHDAELLYPSVRRALIDRIEGAIEFEDDDVNVTRTGMVRLDAMRAGRIRFVRWFLREEGGAWIEHGHKFDPTCSTPASLSPTRDGRLVQTVAEVATRSFANLMPEIEYDAPDRWTARDYMRWAGARGLRFVVRVVFLYLKTAGRIMALWAGSGRVDRDARMEHEARLERVAANAGLQMSALMALERMAPPPSVTTVAGLLSVTALDVLFAVLIPFVLALGVTTMVGGNVAIAAVAAAFTAAIAVVLVRRQHRPRDVASDMLAVAAQVGDVVGVPLVLMGHSHRGTLERRGAVVYANSGSWLDGSHLVVRRDPRSGKLVEVELRTWRNDGTTCARRMAVPQRGDEPLAVQVTPALPSARTTTQEDGARVIASDPVR